MKTWVISILRKVVDILFELWIRASRKDQRKQEVAEEKAHTVATGREQGTLRPVRPRSGKARKRTYNNLGV